MFSVEVVLSSIGFVAEFSVEEAVGGSEISELSDTCIRLCAKLVEEYRVLLVAGVSVLSAVSVQPEIGKISIAAAQTANNLSASFILFSSVD